MLYRPLRFRVSFTSAITSQMARWLYSLLFSLKSVVCSSQRTFPVTSEEICLTNQQEISLKQVIRYRHSLCQNLPWKNNNVTDDSGLHRSLMTTVSAPNVLCPIRATDQGSTYWSLEIQRYESIYWKHFGLMWRKNWNSQLVLMTRCLNYWCTVTQGCWL